ncbi:MAG: ABC transporter permease [Saccharofermentanales bacterium]
MDINDFRKLIIEENRALQTMKWDYFFDYTSIVIDDIPLIINANSDQTMQFSHVTTVGNSVPYTYNGIDTLEDYDKDKKPLTMMIFIFTIPLFLLLLYSIFFISKLVVEMDKNEISVLQSRGASKSRIISIYLFQSFSITILPLLIAPFFAKYISRVLGNTSGFLQFSKNITLNPYVSTLVVLFDVIACFIVIITMLIPSLIASRTNIVNRKTGNSTKSHTPFWKKYNLDFALLAVTGYGYYNLSSRQKTLVTQNITADQLPVEPLTFLILFAFIIASGLLFIRLYPILISLISSVRNDIWSASLYSSFKKVVDIKDKEQFLILFIIITMSLGIFNANTAQTINRNINDNILYAGSADMVVIPYPEKSRIEINMNDPHLVQKPIFSAYNDLRGVRATSIISMAKTPQIYANLQQSTDKLKMIGIDPKTYSEVVWSRPDMLDKHINHYLNLLVKNPESCIITKNIADEMGLKTGDFVQINTNEYGYGGFTLKIAAIVVIWPSSVYSPDNDGNVSQDQLIVTDSFTLENKYQDVLYQVLLKTEKGTTSASINKQLSDIALPAATIYDYKSDISASENSAQRQSFNALLTFSFVIIFTVCFMGFILYWVFSIKSRVLQFGILRAMGMSSRSVYAMLIYEQLFISLSTIIYSIFIGGIASRIFMKIILITFNASQQVLPFKFISSRLDFTRIYVFFSIMIIFTFLIIVFLFKRIKIAQTIKLGED